MNGHVTVVAVQSIGATLIAACGAAWAVLSVIIGLHMPSRPGKADPHSGPDVGE